MTTEPTTGSAGLIDRIKNILLTPRAEWDRIDGEPAETTKLYTGYLLPLAALAAICMVIGLTMFSWGAFGVSVRFSPVQAVISGVFQFAMAFVGCYVLALVINALAPNFGSTANVGQAHKVAVYGSTASLLAGVFSIHPALGILALLGLYSLALLFIGLPKLMKTPEDKRIGYFATVLIVAIVLYIVIGVVAGTVRGAIGGMTGPSFSMGQSAPSTTVEGQVTLPGGGSIELSEIEKLGQAAANGGGGVTVAPSDMQALLPQSLPGGFAMSSSSASSAMGVTQAEGVYSRGDAQVTLTLVNMGQMGGIASMAGAMGVTETRQDADGYSRTNTVDGRMVTEQMSRSSGTASYGVVGRGVAVTAEGRGVSVDDVRAAVEAVGVQRLEQMAAG